MADSYMWKHWLNAILGLVVLAVPFLGLTGATLAWTLAISGIIVAVLSVWSAMETSPDRRSSYVRQ